MIVVPNFAAWRCDSCSYTRYDVAAVKRLELLLGDEGDRWSQRHPRRSQRQEGPGEQGPHRWSS
jgi:hypothetical protein